MKIDRRKANCRSHWIWKMINLNLLLALLVSADPVPTPLSLPALRGGSLGFIEASLIELNPRYEPPPSGQIYVGQLGEEVRAQLPTPFASMKPVTTSEGLFDAAQTYVQRIHRVHPILSLTLVTSTLIFGLWQVPAMQPTLQRHFVLSRDNLRRGRWHTLLTSSISHTGLTHFLFNIAAFLNFGPELARSLSRLSNWTLLPLCAGAALAGSLGYLLIDRKHGGCLGLSSVVLGMLAVFCRFYPQQQIGVYLMGIVPLRFQAQHWLNGMILWSAIGSVALTSSNVAHASHLGGLCFGLVYYEAFLRRFFWCPQATRMVKRVLSPFQR